MSTEDWLNRWLSTYCANKRPSTRAGYENLIQNHIAPAIGQIPLAHLSPEDTQALINSIQASGLSRTAQLVFDVLRASCRRAVRSGHLASNIVDCLDRPTHATKAGTAMSLADEGAFVRAAQSSPLWPAFALMLRAGLRRGEVLALRWQDIDLQARWIHIRHTATPINRQLVIGPPKSKAGIRSVPICNSLHAALSAQRINSLAHGHAGQICPIICHPNGNMASPDSLRKACNAICKEACISRFRLHDLRHTFATRALQNGMNIKTLQNVLGHASMKLTMDLYSHAQLDYIYNNFLECFGSM